jgi:Effector protein
MTLFIQKDGGTAGSGSVFPDRGSTHLIAISNLDAGYNETDLGGGSDLIQAAYAQSTTGPCPTRLNALVNTDFPTPTGNQDIIIVPSDNGFVLNDGSAVGPGITLPPNFGTLNPANSVVVIYDTTDNAGQGVCVKGEGSSDLNVQSPPSVILYHELSHAFRICTGASLDSTETDCASASAEEHAAEVDENDMRDQLGIPHRDANNHCANVGCQSTTCCVVASIACGSPYSEEVNALRDIRDRYLRPLEVGFDFFEQLHRDYYTFSPQVCTMMARSPDLKFMIGAYFVRPLTQILRLIYAYTAEGCAPDELGERFDAMVTVSPLLASLDTERIDELSQILGQQALPCRPGQGQEIAFLEALLRERAHSSPLVHWGLVEPLLMYLGGMRRRIVPDTFETLGAWLAATIDEWASRVPITEAWSRLSWHDRAGELDCLARVLLPTRSARSRFAERLLEFFEGNPRMDELLRARGFREGDAPCLT